MQSQSERERGGGGWIGEEWVTKKRGTRNRFLTFGKLIQLIQLIIDSLRQSHGNTFTGNYQRKKQTRPVNY